MKELKPEAIGRNSGIKMNQIFYESLVVRTIKVFVGSPNFQLNNCYAVIF